MDQPDMFSSLPPSSALPQGSSEKLQRLPDPELFADGLPADEKTAWVDYLYANPRAGTKTLNLRNHVIGLYDPFARRRDFPAGRRWCVNVYVGCAYSCRYCYIVSYVKDAFKPRLKQDFRKSLVEDLKELEALGLHPAPIHISNSTDPLQPLEKTHKNTLFLLRELHRYRHRFTTITILTKNPKVLCSPEYMEIIQTLTRLQVEVTCPFSRDEPRRYFERGAPRIEDRLEAIGTLREKDVRVALRIDPVFPREPLPNPFFAKSKLRDYGAPEAQTEKDLETLIRFAAEVGCSRIIVSPLKLTTSRINKSQLMPLYRDLFKAANGGTLKRKGTAYRLPWRLYQNWVDEPAQLAASLGIPFVYCKKNLFTTY